MIFTKNFFRKLKLRPNTIKPSPVRKPYLKNQKIYYFSTTNENLDENLLNYISQLKEKVELGLKEEIVDIEEPEIPKSSFNEIKNLNTEISQLLSLGEMKKANEVSRRCVDLVYKFYSPNHPVSLSAMNNLAIILKKNGELQEAKSIMINVFEGYCTILGSR